MSILVDGVADPVLTTTVSDEGVWEGKLDYRTYIGEGYDLEVAREGESIVLYDVAFEEVWVCSGQSNMEWAIKGVR